MVDDDKKTDKRSGRLEQRRHSIVEAAAHLFIGKGFHQTGMRDIAQQAGISLGNLYNHFKGKNDIIFAIGELETVDLEPLLGPLEQANEQDQAALQQFIKAYFKLCSGLSYAALSAEITAEVFRNPKILSGFIETRKRMEAAVERHLPQDLDDRSATAGVVIDMIEKAAQSAAGEPKSRQAAGVNAVLEIVSRMVQPR